MKNLQTRRAFVDMIEEPSIMQIFHLIISLGQNNILLV